MAENPIKVLGMKRIVLLAAGALLVFGVSVLLHLYLCGILNLSSPYFRPAEGYAAVDSILAVWAAEDDKSAATMRSPGQPVFDSVQTAPPGSPDSTSAGERMDAGSVVDREETNPEGGDGSIEGEPEHTLNDSPSAGDPASPSELDGTGHPDSTVAGDDGLKPLLPFDESKLSRLVRVYEKMRPKQVATILTTMPDRQVVTILSHMKENKAAQVLAEMEPGKAARISQALMNWSTYEH